VHTASAGSGADKANPAIISLTTLDVRHEEYGNRDLLARDRAGALCTEQDIRAVPLLPNLNGHSYRDGIDLTAGGFPCYGGAAGSVAALVDASC
jgi:hypothetical protein